MSVFIIKKGKKLKYSSKVLLSDGAFTSNGLLKKMSVYRIHCKQRDHLLHLDRLDSITVCNALNIR